MATAKEDQGMQRQAEDPRLEKDEVESAIPALQLYAVLILVSTKIFNKGLDLWTNI